jgi:hypothetical protein
MDRRHDSVGFGRQEAEELMAAIDGRDLGASNPTSGRAGDEQSAVILTTPGEVDQWLEADTMDALALQRPMPDDAPRIVASGEKEDGVAA